MAGLIAIGAAVVLAAALAGLLCRWYDEAVAEIQRDGRWQAMMRERIWEDEPK